MDGPAEPQAPTSRARRGGLAAGLALLLGACSGVVTSPGPFGNGGTPGGECADLAPGQVLTYGFEEFPNRGGTATIERVTLKDAHNIQVLHDWAVPITGHYLYGVLDNYDPNRELTPGVQWAPRQAADGAVIRHSPRRDVTNLVLVLKPTASKGTASGLDVLYKSGGTEYDMFMPTTVELIVGKKTCLA